MLTTNPIGATEAVTLLCTSNNASVPETTSLVITKQSSLLRDGWPKDPSVRFMLAAKALTLRDDFQHVKSSESHSNEDSFSKLSSSCTRIYIHSLVLFIRLR